MTGSKDNRSYKLYLKTYQRTHDQIIIGDLRLYKFIVFTIRFYLFNL